MQQQLLDENMAAAAGVVDVSERIRRRMHTRERWCWQSSTFCWAVGDHCRELAVTMQLHPHRRQMRNKECVVEEKQRMISILAISVLTAAARAATVLVDVPKG